MTDLTLTARGTIELVTWGKLPGGTGYGGSTDTLVYGVVKGDPVDDLDSFMDELDIPGAECGPPAVWVAAAQPCPECHDEYGERTHRNCHVRCIGGRPRITIVTHDDRFSVLGAPIKEPHDVSGVVVHPPIPIFGVDVPEEYWTRTYVSVDDQGGIISWDIMLSRITTPLDGITAEHIGQYLMLVQLQDS